MAAEHDGAHVAATLENFKGFEHTRRGTEEAGRGADSGGGRFLDKQPIWSQEEREGWEGRYCEDEEEQG